jgi:hypothetical protein
MSRLTTIVAQVGEVEKADAARREEADGLLQEIEDWDVCSLYDDELQLLERLYDGCPVSEKVLNWLHAIHRRLERRNRR